MSNELKIENLNYNDILKGINITLEEGTINALMGKSGSGKTLLLKCMFGLVEYNGLINFNGKLITKENISGIRKDFGIYLGIDNLEFKNVFLNITEPLKNLNYPDYKAKKMVYDISKKLGIENLLYKDINELSYCQKKMVSFAQSIIHEPKVILIDGLFQSLDVFYKNKVTTYLKQLKKSKKSIIIFTTNFGEDLLFCENLLIINNGKIIAKGPFKELLEDENIFLKNDINLPFLADLSHKLKAYDLIERLIYDFDEMVDEIW